MQVQPSITVQYYRSPSHVSQVYGYALRVKVTKSEGMPSKIFVYQRGKMRTNDGKFIDHFINIASPVDMDNVPEDEPSLENNIPYYRKDTVKLYFRCLQDLEECKDDISGDIFHLVQTYKYLEDEDNFEKIEEKTYE